MAKSETKKAVATAQTTGLMIPTTKQDVPKAIEILKAQLAAKRGTIDEKISLDIVYTGKNIKDVTTVKELLEISASIHTRAQAYDLELDRYNLKEANIAKFSQSEKSVEDWVKIIGKRINEVINNSEISRLESAIAKLSKHLDAETQLANELADIMSTAQEAIK